MLLGLLAAAVLAAAALAWMSRQDGSDPGTELPGFVVSQGPAAREAYSYAVAHPEVLSKLPCFCGCVNVGHANNEDCFVDSRLDDGSIMYDRHGST